MWKWRGQHITDTVLNLWGEAGSWSVEVERVGYQSVASVREAGSWSVEVVGHHSVESGEGSWSVEVERAGYHIHSVESVGEAGSWSVGSGEGRISECCICEGSRQLECGSGEGTISQC